MRTILAASENTIAAWSRDWAQAAMVDQNGPVLDGEPPRRHALNDGIPLFFLLQRQFFGRIGPLWACNPRYTWN